MQRWNSGGKVPRMSRTDDGKQMRKKHWLNLRRIFEIAVPLLVAASLRLGDAHRQRPAGQVLSTTFPSTAPTAFPSANPSSASKNKEPSASRSRKPTRSVGTMSSRTSLPSSIPSFPPSLTWTPSLHPSFDPTLLPTDSPSNPVDLRTVPCSLDSTTDGYEDQDSFLADIDEIQIEKPFLLCPNVTFEDMKIVITARDVPLSIECGGDECFWWGTEMIITGPTASVAFIGITFEGSAETFLVASGSAATVYFTECIWLGNSGMEILRIEGEKPRSATTGASRADDGRVLKSFYHSQSNKFDKALVIGNETPSDIAVSSSWRSKDARRSYHSISSGRPTSYQEAFVGGGVRGERGERAEGSSRFLKSRNVSVSFSACSFVQNIASASLVSSRYGELRFKECSFVMNDVAASLITVEGGKLDLRGVRFDGNSYSGSEGIIFATATPTMKYNESTCSLNNTAITGSASAGCEGVLIDDTKECIGLERCDTFSPTESPSGAPSVAPSFLARDCYETLQALQAAVVDAETRDEPAVIQVCSNSILDGNTEYRFSPLNISKGIISIECGKTGALSERCMMFGGINTQVHIGTNVKSISFSGFSMVDAGTVSVLAGGQNRSEATFRNCQWWNNRAVAAVLVYNEAFGERYRGQRNLEQMKSPSKPSMAVNFVDCYFEENAFSFSAIAAIRGRANVKSALFQDNAISRLGSIGAMIASAVQITSSCFIKNRALLHGVVVIDITSNITENMNNFGQENYSILGNCTSVFEETSGTCVVDGKCQGECFQFAAESCEKSITEVDRPIRETPAPVLTPTMAPELPPPPTQANATANTKGNETANAVTNGTNAGESDSSTNASMKVSPGAIVMIVVLVLIVLGVACAFMRKGKKKDGVAKSDQKVTFFKHKDGQSKATNIKEQKNGAQYDEFHDYDRILDNDFENNCIYDDDDKSERPASKGDKIKTSKGGWFARRGVPEAKKTQKKSNTKPKSRKRGQTKERKKLKQFIGKEDDDSSSSSNDNSVDESFDDEPESSEASELVRRRDKKVKSDTTKKSKQRRQKGDKKGKGKKKTKSYRDNASVNSSGEGSDDPDSNEEIKTLKMQSQTGAQKNTKPSGNMNDSPKQLMKNESTNKDTANVTEEETQSDMQGSFNPFV